MPRVGTLVLLLLLAALAVTALDGMVTGWHWGTAVRMTLLTLATLLAARRYRRLR